MLEVLDYLDECVDLPFDDENLPKLIDKIVLAQFEYPPSISSEAKDLLSALLVPNPNKRLNLAQIKNHPWLKGGEDHKRPTLFSGLGKSSSKDLTDLNPDEYQPLKYLLTSNAIEWMLSNLPVAAPESFSMGYLNLNTSRLILEMRKLKSCLLNS